MTKAELIEAIKHETDTNVLHTVEAVLRRRPELISENDPDFDNILRTRIEEAQAGNNIPIEELIRHYGG